MKVVIIDYGSGNITSVINALHRMHIHPVLSSHPEEIKSAERVIFPGVGQATSAMEKLKLTRLDTLLPHLEQPVLGVCLGMQLMCAHTEEGNIDGLNIFPVQVRKFIPNKVQQRVPHMGWNKLNAISSKIIPSESQHPSYAYFVHSYYAEHSALTSASTDFILPFSAALELNNFYGVQFHPEKSGKFGQEIIQNFIDLPNKMS
jgi:glutamine amidotransferase